MSELSNVEVVKQIYAAFGRGDISGIVNALADDVEWETPAPGGDIPIGGRCRGRQEVEDFFVRLGQYSEMHHFEPQDFIAQGDKVVVLGRYREFAKNTGRSFELDWAMAWTFQNGKVTKFREYSDSLPMAIAFGVI